MEIYMAPRDGMGGSEAVYGLLEYAFQKKYRDKLPTIEKTPNGKPFFPGRPDVHFSLSHASTHVLCALSDYPVGVDIESPRPVSDRTLRFFYHPEELELFERLDLWVLKESHIKLIGGVLTDVKKIRFSRQLGKIYCSDGDVFVKLYRLGSCHAAVSSLGEPPPDSVIIVERM